MGRGGSTETGSDPGRCPDGTPARTSTSPSHLRITLQHVDQTTIAIRPEHLWLWPHTSVISLSRVGDQEHLGTRINNQIGR